MYMLFAPPPPPPPPKKNKRRIWHKLTIGVGAAGGRRGPVRAGMVRGGVEAGRTKVRDVAAGGEGDRAVALDGPREAVRVPQVSYLVQRWTDKSKRETQKREEVYNS